jgi:hypothetical protein
MGTTQTMTPQATTIPPGLTRPTLYTMGERLGMTKDAVNQTIQRHSRLINSLLIIAVTILGAVSALILATPGRYHSVSTQDFDNLGQAIYQMFGRP